MSLMKSKPLMLVVLCAAILAWNAPVNAAQTTCQKLYARYTKAPGHKAFATTLGNDPGFHPTSCSFVAKFTFKRLAEKKAVQDCNRIRRKEDGGKCRVIHSK
jgi:hypothetical protein